MNADRIAEIRERLDKATPGPWSYNEGYFGINANGKRYLDRVANANGMADTRLIAHAPDDLAFLLDLVAPVPSGEVETPCATCAGAGFTFQSDGVVNHMVACPDCGEIEIPPDVCCQLHPENRRRCQLVLAHDEVAHSWERYNAAGDVVEHYEWLGDDER